MVANDTRVNMSNSSSFEDQLYTFLYDEGPHTTKQLVEHFGVRYFTIVTALSRMMETDAIRSGMLKNAAMEKAANHYYVPADSERAA